MTDMNKPLPRYAVYTTVVAQGITWIIARALLALFARLEVQGLENLKDLPRGVIFASNHANDLDPILTRAALPLFSQFSPLFLVARQRQDYEWTGWKAVVYCNPLFRALGAYPAFKGTKNYKKSLRIMVDIGRAGYPIVIFTGGKQLTPTGPVQVRGGTGYLCHATKQPIVPMAIEGTFGFGPRLFLRRPHSVVRYGKPLHHTELFTHGRTGIQDFRRASAAAVQQIEYMRREIRKQYFNTNPIHIAQPRKEPPSVA